MTTRTAGVAILCALGASGCAAAGAGAGLSRSAAALGWGELALEMSLEEVETRIGRRLETHAIDDPCAEAGARLAAGGEELFLAFERDAREAPLRTIVRRLPAGVARGELVGDLRRRLPGLRYRPDPRWPKMPEEEDPTPLYVHPELPGQAVELRFEDGWMWIGHLRCLDRRATDASREETTR